MITSLPATSPTERPHPPGSAAPWRRAAAWLADVVTVLFINLAFVLIGGAALVDAAVTRWSPDPWGDSFVPTLLYAAIFLAYETTFVAVRGQTPGMDLVDIEVVVTSSGPGGPRRPGWRRALVRTLPLAALRLVPGALLGTAAMLTVGVSIPADRRRRGLHDLLSGTTVVDSYDVDTDEPGPIDRDELAETYGPRRLIDFIRRRD